MKHFIYKNRDTLLAVIAGMMIIVTVICASYAYYFYDVEIPNNNDVVSTDFECFDITISGNSLNISDDLAVPMHDSVVLEDGNDDYKTTVTIKNTCEFQKMATLGISPDVNNGISADKIKYVFYENESDKPETGEYLSSITTNALSEESISDINKETGYTVSDIYPLYTSYLKPGEEKTFTLYTWIDYYEGDTTSTGANNNSTINSAFKAAISVVPTIYDTTKTLFTDLLNSSAVSSSEIDPGENGFIADSTYGNRFVGPNPNNYVYFNCSDYDNPSNATCQKWRIVGTFDSTSHGVSGKTLIKLVYTDLELDGIKYDYQTATGTNNWNKSQTMMLLNPATYSTYNIYNDRVMSSSGSYVYYAMGGYYYSSSTAAKTLNIDYVTKYSTSDASQNYDLSSTGITEATRSYIQEVNIPMRYITSNTDVSLIYNQERAGTSYASNWTGLITIPFFSDEAMSSSGNNDTSRSTCMTINSSTYADCYNGAWLKGNTFTMSGFSGGSLLLYTPNSTSTVAPNYPTLSALNVKMSIMPTIYLTDDVHLVSGEGTKGNPYIIKK